MTRSLLIVTEKHLQIFVGRELVKWQILSAPTRVCTFVETTVHVRRHFVCLACTALGERAAADAAGTLSVAAKRRRFAYSCVCTRRGPYAKQWTTKTITKRVQNWINFLKLKRCFTLITGYMITNCIGDWRHHPPGSALFHTYTVHTHIHKRYYIYLWLHYTYNGMCVCIFGIFKCMHVCACACVTDTQILCT